MSTRNRSRTCKNCGELPMDQFTPELRAECRACYNSKRRLKNTLGHEKLMQGTWIQSSQLSGLYQRIEVLEAQISLLTSERSLVDQELKVEISAKEQCLTQNQQLETQVRTLQAQIFTLTSERPLVDQLEHQISETTQRLMILETRSLETQTQILDLQALITQQSKELFNGEHISTQLNTLSHLLSDRPLIDQVKILITEQFDPFLKQLTAQSTEIGRLQQLIPVKDAQLFDRSVVDQLEMKIQDRLQARDLQLAELLSQLKLQSDQISSLINDRPVVDQGAPNSTPRTPPRQISPLQHPMSAEPPALTVHPEPINEPRPVSSNFFGPVITQKMDQLQAHGLPLSMPAGFLSASSRRSLPLDGVSGAKKSPPPFVRPPPSKK